MKNSGLKRENDIFCGSTIGMIANTTPKWFRKSYFVKGTYMDSNGCMKTYGVDSDGRDSESFIAETDYN